MRAAERDIVVLGFSDDARALVEHLRAEAPALLERIVVIDRRPEVVERLNRTGIATVCGDPFDPGALSRAGTGRTTLVLQLDPRGPGFSELARLVERLCPGPRLLVSPPGALEMAPASASRPTAMADAAGSRPEPSGLWARLTAWQFWLLVGVAAADAAIFVVPVASAALCAPGFLRWVARVLDTLAERR